MTDPRPTLLERIDEQLGDLWNGHTHQVLRDCRLALQRQEEQIARLKQEREDLSQAVNGIIIIEKRSNWQERAEAAEARLRVLQESELNCPSCGVASRIGSMYFEDLI